MAASSIRAIFLYYTHTTWNRRRYISKSSVKMPRLPCAVLLTPPDTTSLGGLLLMCFTRSAADMTIKAHGKGIVPTDLSVAIPKNCYGRVGMRVLLNVTRSTAFGACCEEVHRCRRWSGGLRLPRSPRHRTLQLLHEDFEVKKGDRVAQFILERICMAPIVEVESLDETERGEGGFGSTGIKKLRSEWSVFSKHNNYLQRGF